MFQPNQLQIVKYIPVKPVYLYGFPAVVVSIIFSYLKSNDYDSLLSTYYRVQLFTERICSITKFNKIEMLKSIEKTINKYKFEYLLKEIAERRIALSSAYRNISDYRILMNLYTRSMSKIENARQSIDKFIRKVCLINGIDTSNNFMIDIKLLTNEQREALNCLFREYYKCYNKFLFLERSLNIIKSKLTIVSGFMHETLFTISNILNLYIDHLNEESTENLVETYIKYATLNNYLESVIRH